MVHNITVVLPLCYLIIFIELKHYMVLYVTSDCESKFNT